MGRKTELFQNQFCLQKVGYTKQKQFCQILERENRFRKLKSKNTVFKNQRQRKIVSQNFKGISGSFCFYKPYFYKTFNKIINSSSVRRGYHQSITSISMKEASEYLLDVWNHPGTYLYLTIGEEISFCNYTLTLLMHQYEVGKTI